MSLANLKKSEILQILFLFKLKSYSALFTSLILVQILAMLFSLSGPISSGSFGFSGPIHVNIGYYTGDIIVGFTLVWGFVAGLLLTTKKYYMVDFLFVTTRKMSQVANLLFLVAISIIGTLTAQLAGGFIQSVNVFFNDVKLVTNPLIISELLLSIGSLFFYLLFMTIIGYFIGMCVQLHKVFIIVLPAIFVGTIVQAVRLGDGYNFITKSYYFIIQESIFVLFSLKIFVLITILFVTAFLIGKRMEVQQ
ncbi:hypothetical protein GCM10011351_08760 [Paraliobacillus quinghaiensis]|uniref:Uncharacterized protein n=1 Tax=Paraliobacillus quinghaiensis TaxID=470815 RepID=A0A917WRG0_9BACI|nr:hypothetical protein [Paraliobacillus quinghaiensis]GGM25269.1 hypothetical protein GCM10011351_08760 [Paraliobacillus quinghaiensis]